uniref:Plant bHLH transcription factor ACT-like domain-containing protein n=1 Tax=Oryza glaberrima TaxID=4538 RepID=I1R3E0_ORYGL
MQVSVSSVELEKKRGFRINVSMEKSQPELLTSVLEAFEELGLDVLDADVSCADDTAFRLEALGSSQSEAAERSVDEQMVRHAVLQAIKKCMDGSSI